MTRDEAKKQMRLDLEMDLSMEDRNIPSDIYSGLTANQVMEEVEKSSDIGERFLDDFIAYQNGKYFGEEVRKNVVRLMEADLEKQPAGFADKSYIKDDDGNLLTPRQVVQQFKEGTDFGNRYAEQWLEMRLSLKHSYVESAANNEQSN
jgi:hypothetical protein